MKVTASLLVKRDGSWSLSGGSYELRGQTHESMNSDCLDGFDETNGRVMSVEIDIPEIDWEPTTITGTVDARPEEECPSCGDTVRGEVTVHGTRFHCIGRNSDGSDCEWLVLRRGTVVE